jgi:tetratricopeptide (TPR) repeat protein
LSLARQRLLHRRAAEALWQHTRVREREALAGLVAQHYQRAGQEAAAAGFYRRAGEYARTLYANQEALAQFQAALALGQSRGEPRDPLETMALHEAVGDLQTMLGNYDAALSSYEAAAALAETIDPGVARARLEHRLGRVYERRGEWALAEGYYQAALAALESIQAPATEGSFRAHVYADRSRTARSAGQHEEARRLAAMALQLAGQAGDTQALAQAHNISGIVARHAGERAQAIYHLEQSLELARAEREPGAQVAALNNLGLTAAEPEQALELLEQALALCQAQGDRHREAAIHSNLADLLHATGQEERAMAHLKQSAAIYSDIGKQGAGWEPEIWKLMEW